MKYYKITHYHKHGIDAYPFKTTTPWGDLRAVAIAEALDIDYDPDAWLEDLEIEEIDLTAIPEI